jgi:myosin protein heavy chain
MERSLHNDSGHGKSTAQIIRDLKASNAHFSAKTAEMEAEFMNEINRVTRTFEEKNRALEAALKEKSHQVTSMEARCSSTEARIREQNAQVVKLKDENAFQRMTISDLKNQLHTLQDAEDSKRDEVDKRSREKDEMTREITNLRGQVETLKSGILQQDNGQDGKQILQSWKQLEESQKALSISSQRLHETQSAFAIIENTSKKTAKEHARTVHEHSQELARLKKKHVEAQAEWSRSEMEMQATIERLESDENPVIKDLKTQLQECDSTIALLRDEVACNATKVTEITTAILKVKSEAKSREAYRREEAEDLRVMLDAQADEIDQLKEELDECQREVFTKEDDLVAAEKELEEQIHRCDELKRELEALKGGEGEVGIEGSDRVIELESQLADARESLRKLETELEETHIKHEGVVAELRQEIDDLIADRDDKESRLVVVEEERDQAREALTSVDCDRELPESDPSSAEQSKELRADAERHANEIAEMEKKVHEMDIELRESRGIKEKMEKLQVELETANQSVKEKTEEVAALQSKLDDKAKSLEAKNAGDDVEKERAEELEGQSEELEKTKQQLLDAQIALVALDNERKKLAKAYRDKSEELERQEKETEVKTTESKDYSCRIAELVDEVRTLKTKLKEKEEAIETASSRALAVNGESSLEEEALRKEISILKDSEAKLNAALEAIKKEKNEQEEYMNLKLVDRDTTISALVKSSVTQDQKLRALQAEVESIKSTQGINDASLDSASRTSRNVGNGEDIERLRKSLTDSSEAEKKLSSELSSYKKNLFAAELEAQRLREEMEEARGISGKSSAEQLSALKKEMNTMTLEHQEKIHERDAAIATLVKQSMAQEAYVLSLEAKFASIKSEMESLSISKAPTSPTWNEIQRLRKESEIFAGQIIEQDEEMEALKGELEGRQSDILSLKNELKELKMKKSSSQNHANEVVRLRAELDEMQEANSTQLMELRDLRRELREAKVRVGQMADLKIELDQAKRALEEPRTRRVVTERDDPTTKSELADVRAAKASLERALAEQMETIRSTKSAAADLEALLQQREYDIAELKNELSKSSSSKDGQLAALQSEVDRLRGELKTQSALAEEAQSSMRDFQKSVDDSEVDKDSEMEAVAREVAELRSQLKSLEDDRAHIDELKERLAHAEQSRESVEKSIIDSYERKMSLMKLNKDVTIDGLRKELAEAKGRNVGDLDGLMKRIQQLEVENKDLSHELEAMLDQKNAKIYALEQHCHAQDQLVGNMRAEMDQLQSSMERTNLNRRSELDEMQQEMLDSSAKTTRQEREITALKIELEEVKLEQEAKVAKLLEKIASMEASPLARAVAEQHVDHRLEEVKARLEQMRWHNTSLEQENAKLRSRLGKAETTSKAIEDEMDRIGDLEEEIAFLQGRVNELVKEKEQQAAAPAPHPEKPPTRPTPPTVESRGRNSQPASAKPSSSNSGRLRFLKLRTRGSSKEVSRDEIPPLPGDD